MAAHNKRIEGDALKRAPHARRYAKTRISKRYVSLVYVAALS
jgi:hypothetical protein